VALALILIIAVSLLDANVRKLLRLFKPALVFIVVIAAFQWLFSGPSVAALSFARISLLYTAGSIVTVSTTETEFIMTIEWLLSPVSKLTGTNIGKDIATMMTLAMAFLPIIKDEHDTIRLAQEARGVSHAGIKRLIECEIAVIVPLVYGLAARADRVATAMEARCYGHEK
jgi:energy-coupling factor transporter transmembrane protein EcfT